MHGKMVYDEIVEATQRGEEYDPDKAPTSDADAIARDVIEVCLLELLPAIVAENPALKAKIADCCFAHWRLGRE